LDRSLGGTAGGVGCPRLGHDFRSIVVRRGLLGDAIAGRLGTPFDFIQRRIAKAFAAQQTATDANRAAEVEARFAAEQGRTSRGGKKGKRKFGWSAHDDFSD
jgi:hypothetical protein